MTIGCYAWRGVVVANSVWTYVILLIGWPNMKPTDRTLDQIRRDGLIALRRRLGVEGMVRFLQQFERGTGDYAAQRRKWVDRTSIDDIRAMLQSPSRRKARKTA